MEKAKRRGRQRLPTQSAVQHRISHCHRSAARGLSGAKRNRSFCLTHPPPGCRGNPSFRCCSTLLTRRVVRACRTKYALHTKRLAKQRASALSTRGSQPATYSTQRRAPYPRLTSARHADVLGSGRAKVMAIWISSASRIRSTCQCEVRSPRLRCGRANDDPTGRTYSQTVGHWGGNYAKQG